MSDPGAQKTLTDLAEPVSALTLQASDATLQQRVLFTGD